MREPASERFDACVVGAGPAGLVAALALAHVGARVAAFGPAGANRDDPRTSALFMGAIRLIERIGVWPALHDRAAPLAVMRIVDRLSRSDYPSVILFEACELGPEPFGYNIANPDLTGALERRIAGEPRITRIAKPVATIAHEDGRVTLAADDGEGVAAALVVAADGRGSPARAAAGIGARTWDYRQSALVATIAHSRPHRGVTCEVHRAGGPFTTVPLPGERSAVLWLDTPEAAEALAALDDRALARRFALELDGFLGDLSIEGRRGLFAIGGLAVDRIAGRRTALIGEAAHVVPPIGAQGLNLGLRDAAWLAGLVGDALAGKRDPGGDALLRRYADARRGDVAARRAASDLLNRSLLFDFGPLRGARGVALTLAAGLGPVRRRLMRDGLVSERALPRLMRKRPAEIRKTER